MINEISNHPSKAELYTMSKYQKLSEEFIEKHLDEVNWYTISAYQKLSEKFIEKYSDKVIWNYIAMKQKLSEDFIERNFLKEGMENIFRCCVCENQKLSEKFIEKYEDRVNWMEISMYQKLSEDFIEKFSDKVYWDYISIYQKLSENFIEKHSNEVNWSFISIFQPLSESFIEKHANKVDWCKIAKYQVLSKSFAKRHFITIQNNCHRTVHKWKKMIIDSDMYECHRDYFYAYKGIRNDRYSNRNFQYQYLPGETYECFSDYSNDESSFGLSAWTEEAVKDYCDELVVKVKIYYRDVTAVVHDSNKIRCKKLTVLN